MPHPVCLGFTVPLQFFITSQFVLCSVVPLRRSRPVILLTSVSQSCLRFLLSFLSLLLERASSLGSLPPVRWSHGQLGFELAPLPG